MPSFINYGKLVLPDYIEEPESAIDRTQMEDGPAKQAQVRSLRQVPRNIVMLFTETECANFRTWFTSTISMGAVWFDWPDPADGVTKLARIVNGIYSAKPYTGTDPGLSWEVSFKLETWE